ncbi:hypothetical protein [Rossellomorea marisflavi]|uniref:hypothetical protein n=1 Tax=Rossellomorea marisflavi TaxID=189381 RepID=UPI003D2EC35A
MQRRPPDSYGNSGQGETLQAQPKRLTARPMESGWPQRNGTISYPPKQEQDGNVFNHHITLPSHREKRARCTPGKREAAAKRNGLVSTTHALKKQNTNRMFSLATFPP